MNTPSALVVLFPGTNCHVETTLALKMAGFTVIEAHVNRLLDKTVKLDDFHLLALAGGFSYGDDIASGKVAANKLMVRLRDQVLDFAKERLIIGICNGFQTLVKAGLLPAVNNEFSVQATLTYNDLGHFYCNWIRLQNVNKGKCVFTKGIEFIDLPVAHGEGKLIVKDESVLTKMIANDQVVFKYMGPDNLPANGEFPFNPANTLMDITGICDPSGRIFGCMPHPERYLYKENHPRWTAGQGSDVENGKRIFQNASDYVSAHLL